MKIDAGQLSHQELNDQLRMSREQNIIIENCLGQRYLASGSRGKKVTVTGTPGNALGSYLDDTEIDVYGNVQEATGDTMNGGAIYIHGSAGDATGYAMRGGKILIQGDTGYRAGVHMKEYKDKIPAIVVGGVQAAFRGISGRRRDRGAGASPGEPAGSRAISAEPGCTAGKFT